jgi:glutamate 5-kinase
MSQLEYKKRFLRRARRVVVKVGSQVLSSAAGIEAERIRTLAQELAALHDREKEIVVVSSGAVAAGMTRLGVAARPKTIPQKQALAAVGQIRLMALYERSFSRFGKSVAQVLLTHEDLANRKRYLNAKHTLRTLLQSRIIPIINENDTVATEEMKFGDNDRLSALVATLLQADLLVILSDVDGVFDRDPRVHRDGRLIPLIESLKAMKPRISLGPAGAYGTGGIVSKIEAAETAAVAGIPTWIANGLAADSLRRLFDPREEIGTLIVPEANRLATRKHWIAYYLRPAGEMVVDRGAYEALVRRKKSLLPSGLKEVRGSFEAGDCVRCLDPSGREFARGLVNYSSQELNRIKGLHTSGIEKALGYKVSDEIIHRDDLVVLAGVEDGAVGQE